ncbi:MAG: glucokinase [Anaerolineae bacterium]
MDAYLIGDMGGTKTVLSLFAADEATPHLLVEQTFPSREYDSLEACIAEFLEQHPARIVRAGFGVAGPVEAGRARITNLSWTIDAAQVSAALGGVPVRLLNDLAAIANAVPFLPPEDVETLNPGQPAPGGTIAVIAPGTGLGEAFLTWDGARYRAYPSEGGHTDFGPTDRQELGLLEYLLARKAHVSYELICSGLGIPNIYAYLKESGFAEEPAWLTEQLELAVDPTPVIVTTALDESLGCALCQETLRMFVKILGAEAGNLALKVYATGGVYIGGGIPPRILPLLKRPEFLEAFRAKGRFAELLTRVPVHVIKNPKIALLGAYYGLLA